MAHALNEKYCLKPGIIIVSVIIIENHIDFELYNEMIVLSEEDFVKVADTKDIQPSHMKEVQVDGESICIVNVKGKYYAIGNICTHEGGPLADGTH